MTQRYHALDSLRGIVMWLGIVIHVGINHMVGESLNPWRDIQTGILADFLVLFLHTFRMPIFFILAGFFGAMLLDKYGARGMFTNRMKRLALPFVIFAPILIVLTPLLAQMFLSKMTLGYADFDLSTIFHQSDRPVPNTVHLWFLYYLIWFFIFVVCSRSLSQKLSSTFRKRCSVIFSSLATHWWGLIVLTLPLVFTGVFYEFGFLTPNGSLIPNIKEIIHNGTFFVFGWFFFLNREALTSHFQRYCWGYLISGTVVFFIVLVEFAMVGQGKMNTVYDRVTIAFTYYFAGWLWSLSLIGLFLRYFTKQNTVLKYFADSSYWVYLVHVIGTMGFGILLYDTSLSLVPKMVVNIALTSAACLISYHVLVRNTRIGLLLNGRKLSNKEKETTRRTTTTIQDI